MAISQVSNQGATQAVATEKAAQLDTTKKKQQVSSAEQKEAYSVSISDAAKQKELLEPQKDEIKAEGKQKA